MLCKFCSIEKKLIRAHIIPKSFYELLRDGKRHPEIHTNKTGVYPKKSPIGIYDSELVCEECERLFSTPDSYAKRLLLEPPTEENYIYYNGDKIAYQFQKIDYRLLKLFFISLLWRASATNQPFFSRVDVGPFEGNLKEMIISEDPGDPETFAVTLAKFEDPLGTAILDPHPDRWFGVNYIRFYLGGYVAYIKVDRRPTPDFMGQLKLVAGMPLLVILRNLRHSKDFLVMQNIAQTFDRKKID